MYFFWFWMLYLADLDKMNGLSKEEQQWWSLDCFLALLVEKTFFFFSFYQQLIWWVQLWTQVGPPGMESCAQVWEVLAWKCRPPEWEELWAPQVRRSMCCSKTFYFFHGPRKLEYFSYLTHLKQQKNNATESPAFSDIQGHTFCFIIDKNFTTWQNT